MRWCNLQTGEVVAACCCRWSCRGAAPQLSAHLSPYNFTSVFISTSKFRPKFKFNLNLNINTNLNLNPLTISQPKLPIHSSSPPAYEEIPAKSPSDLESAFATTKTTTMMASAPRANAPRNSEEMSHMISEFHRQSLIYQPPVDQGNQPSTAGYGLFSMQTSLQSPSELEPSQRLWPQSEFVMNVIEAPLEHANPGWRDHDLINASSLRQRAEAGMQNPTDANATKSIFQKSKASQGGVFGQGGNLNGGGLVAAAATAAAAAPRDGKKTIPSHLTHMKYKGFDPLEAESTVSDPSTHRAEGTAKGTASFGSKARRRTDTVSLVEEEQKRRDLEHQLANFPPILPGCLWNTLSEEEAESRRAAVEDDMRLKWNIPSARSSSPNLTRRATYNKHGGSNRRASVSMAHEDKGFSSAVGSILGASISQNQKHEAEKQPNALLLAAPSSNESNTYTSVKISHPLLIANNNTWNRILGHMQNHGTIVNPFNHKAKFRLKACFPPGTPVDILASGDTRQSEYPVNPEMLRRANEVVMGPDWIKMTYETGSQAAGSLNSNGVHFDGFPLEVSLWNETDDLGSRSSAPTERPRWMVLSGDTGAGNTLRNPTKSASEPTKTASQRPDRQLVVLHDEAIFLKHPGLMDRIKEFVYGYLFQSTARYDDEGNYIKGSGGVLLDLWHLLTT
ncbi:hypothetical protein AOL_s00112g127 [Orbilia oligospora ATCC 24927]|uniref:Uncharacterized protein n=1 Tax=Arthrobotrys oligospora (strain ATCC 24927 / CBS 115.81 / DSM 1491) TaxID=756982 RepID=G1XLU7_ARTOA|nr:hypothetical protein AOL_s00112g127 [Orbilia oligospora ATCC 24927]EGX45938.1 hypothetical protein AOL_s00112g127 [Orbilia oligospora ATCC 24927]